MRVFIYCGVPGAGKTTIAKRRHPDAVIVSADDYFLDTEGSYNFDHRKLPEAHAECLRRYVHCLREPEIYQPPELVVDNTNTTIAEVAPYAALALAFGHALQIRTLLADPEVAAARNVHGVPVEAVRAMAARLERRELPSVVAARVRQSLIEASRKSKS